MRSGYVGVVLVLLFSLGVGMFFLTFPDLRFYRDAAETLKSFNISTCEPFEDPDDFISASVLSMSVPGTTVGLSFDEFRTVRKSREEAQKMGDAVASSGWKFSSRVLGNMFVSVSNGRTSALVPDLVRQIDTGFASPEIFVVRGSVGSLRAVWEAVSGYIVSQAGIPLSNMIW